MSVFQLEFGRAGLRLPGLGLWLDPHEPQTGPEKVFVSHAHSDHVAAHREVILSGPTSQLMHARVPGQRLEHVLDFGEPREFQHAGVSFRLTLLPAGHIFGSAMALLEAEGRCLLYTGDFKLRRGMSAEPCEPRAADILVMETTFGRPQYVFPPAELVLKGIVRFCREALDNDETAVLLGYSLGKSQELLCGLGDAGLPLMLHGAVHRLTQIYERFGQCFPKYERYEPGAARGKVLLCPPHVINSAMLRNLGKIRSAVLTGWAVDPNCRYRYQCDAAFPLSDHADFPGLIEIVRLVQPKKVYTLHGFAAAFAQTLRELGYDAQPLSEDEQLPLRLEVPATAASRPGSAAPNGTVATPAPESPSAAPGSEARPRERAAFSQFSSTCARIAGDPRKLEKIRLLGEYLRQLSGLDVARAATWFTGRPFPSSQNKVLQLGWAVLRDALCAVGGISETDFHQVYLKHSDLGETAAEVLDRRPPGPGLGLGDVDELFHQLQTARGPLAKTPRLRAALESCSSLEAKYLVKIITGDLRIGLKEGLVEEAIAQAFGQAADAVRKANLLLGDIGETARLASENCMDAATLVPFRPVKFMLASPEQTAADIWERMQDLAGPRRAPAKPNSAGSSEPAADARAAPEPAVGRIWLEDKYDGIRCQLHRAGNRVELFSRDLKAITATFPELARAALKLPADVILDGEIVAMRGDRVLPFAELQKRLGRKEEDLFMRDEVPIQYVVFDLLWRDGRSLLDQPLRERRAVLESLNPGAAGLQLAQITPAASEREIDAAFEAARARGNEGLMIKDPESSYAPGRRGLAWLKLKKAFATLDCVVVGAEYGHGKRNNVLSDYTFAVRDERTGQLKVIGKAYTGLTGAEIEDLTRHFLQTAVRQRGRFFEVPPDTVLEIAFDRLQESPRHDSGLAMRFPRIVRLRTDKTVAEIDTLQTARTIAGRQVGAPAGARPARLPTRTAPQA